MAKSKKLTKQPRTAAKSKTKGKVRLYTLGVYLLSGPLPRTFAAENPVVGRTLQLRGDQTLADLHRAVFGAFDRQEEHSYEFQFGQGPMDPEGPRYVLPGAYDVSVQDGKPAAGRVTDTTLDALGLKVGDRFGYWFDFGEDWWHQINVAAVEEAAPRGRYPKLLKQVGASPPQYPDEDDGVHPLDGSSAADAACLVGEMHLGKGDYTRAVEAFTRAIENTPTADAYEGRAKAYRRLAEADEKVARKLGR